MQIYAPGGPASGGVAWPAMTCCRASGSGSRSRLGASAPAEYFGGAGAAKAWKEIWGCGQGIGVINKVQGAAEFVAQLKREYAQARARLAL